MAGYGNNKLKLLYLYDILKNETNENNPLSINQLIEKLDNVGIEAERKSLYSDFELLSLFGYTVEKIGDGRSTAYYLTDREFELYELKLLSDAVRCSKFLTKNRSDELIAKLKTLTDRHSASELTGEVIVSDRVKTDNKQTIYNVDAIHGAIRDKVKIKFFYFDYNSKKEKVYRHERAVYEISPYALCWQDEYYYVVGYHPKYSTVTNFRVDKMEKIEVLTDGKGRPEKIKPMPDGFKLDEFIKRRFGMFSGEEITMKLKVHNSLSGVMLDRFGKDVWMIPCDDDEHFTLTQTVLKSPILLGWLFQFGDKIEILAPDELISDYKKELRRVLRIYSK